MFQPSKLNIWKYVSDKTCVTYVLYPYGLYQFFPRVIFVWFCRNYAYPIYISISEEEELSITTGLLATTFFTFRIYTSTIFVKLSRSAIPNYLLS